MNSLTCHAHLTPKVTNRALGPTIGPNLQFTKSSHYSPFEIERLKAEQSETGDLPLQALQIDMRPGNLTDSAATIKSPFGEAPAVHFKRTAHALATLEPQSKSSQSATLGCLPVFISKISLSFKKNEIPALCATAPRRRLLPPPKTIILPCEDPSALRALIEDLQQKRNQTLDQGRITSRLQALPASAADRPVFYTVADLQKMLAHRITTAARRLSVVLGDWIDRLAVA